MPGEGPAENHAVRVGQALIEEGFAPTLIVEADEGRIEDRLPDGRFAFQGVPYIPVGAQRPGVGVRGKVSAFLGFGQATLRHLAQATLKPRIVICLAPPSAVLLRLHFWCRRNRVLLVPETMEWHTESIFHRCGVLHGLDAVFRMRVAQRLPGRILVISSFLEDYYSRRGCRTFRLLPILDTQQSDWKFRPSGCGSAGVRLAFSGTPVRDRQDLLLGGLLQMRREGRRFTLDYVGSTREEIRGLLPDPGLLDMLGDAVVCHGRVPPGELPEILGRADYGVLMRDDARWSRACFPSKVPEFLSLGVPMICNLSSDLRAHLHDGNEAYLVESLTVEAVAGAFRRASESSSESRARMRIRARERAERDFDIRRHAPALGAFLRDEVVRAQREIPLHGNEPE